MTAVNIWLTPQAGYLLTDAAHYDADGVVRGIGSKLVWNNALRVAVTWTGRVDTTRLTFFMQMALQAYALLPESDRDIDVRFHAAMLQTQSGMMPTARALADTIMKSSPDNLLGYVIRATAAADSAKAKAARADFRAHYDAEMKKNRPEYVEHRTLLEQYRKGDGSN